MGVSETGTDGGREEAEEGGSTTEEGEEEEEDSRDRLHRENSSIRRLIPTWRGRREFSTKKLMIT